MCGVAGAANGSHVRLPKKDSAIIYHNLIVVSSDFPAGSFCCKVRRRWYFTFFRRFSFPCKRHLSIQPAVAERSVPVIPALPLIRGSGARAPSALRNTPKGGDYFRSKEQNITPLQRQTPHSNNQYQVIKNNNDFCLGNSS